MKIPYDQRNKCPVLTNTGQPCGDPVFAYRDRQQLTCSDHQSDNQGSGTMLCRLCNQPQHDHAPGYYEHAALIAQLHLTSRRLDISNQR